MTANEINKSVMLNNSSEKPLVTVVMPVYNVAAYIEQSLSSVIAQTYKNIEILIVDDESPDNSVAIIEREFSDQRIHIIRQKNRGLAGARNTGIRHAKGQFIAFLDSDDFWQADKIEKHIARMLANTNCGVSFCSSLFVDEAGVSLNRLQAPKKKQNYQPKDIFCRNPIGNGSVPVIRKSILDQICFFDKDKTETVAVKEDSTDKEQSVESRPYGQYFNEALRQSEDVDCWTRIAILTGTEFEYIDEPLTNYRLNNSGLSANVEKQFETWMSLLDNLYQYAPDFAKKYGATAKAFQYRYLARRSVFQGQSFNGFKFMLLAYKTKPLALFSEPRKTLETTVLSAALCLLPRKLQLKVVSYLV